MFVQDFALLNLYYQIISKKKIYETTSGSFLNFNTRVPSAEFSMTQRLFVIYQMICIASQENFYIIQYSKLMKMALLGIKMIKLMSPQY